jgi:GTPase
VIGLNKVDALEPAEVKKLITKLKRATKAEVLPMSGASGEGLQAVLDRLSDAVGAEAKAADTGEQAEWSPL